MRAFCCLVSLFIGARPSAWCRAKRRSWRSERATVALIFLDVLSRPTQSTGEVMEPNGLAAEKPAFLGGAGAPSRAAWTDGWSVAAFPRPPPAAASGPGNPTANRTWAAGSRRGAGVGAEGQRRRLAAASGRRAEKRIILGWLAGWLSWG